MLATSCHMSRASSLSGNGHKRWTPSAVNERTGRLLAVLPQRSTVRLLSHGTCSMAQGLTPQRILLCASRPLGAHVCHDVCPPPTSPAPPTFLVTACDYRSYSPEHPSTPLHHRTLSAPVFARAPLSALSLSRCPRTAPLLPLHLIRQSRPRRRRPCLSTAGVASPARRRPPEAARAAPSPPRAPRPSPCHRRQVCGRVKRTGALGRGL